MTNRSERAADPAAHPTHGDGPFADLLQVLGWVINSAVFRSERHTYVVADSGVDIDPQVYDLEACGLAILSPDGNVTPTQRGQRLWAERHASQRPRESRRSILFVAPAETASR